MHHRAANRRDSPALNSTRTALTTRTTLYCPHLRREDRPVGELRDNAPSLSAAAPRGAEPIGGASSRGPGSRNGSCLESARRPVLDPAGSRLPFWRVARVLRRQNCVRTPIRAGRTWLRVRRSSRTRSDPSILIMRPDGSSRQGFAVWLPRAFRVPPGTCSAHPERERRRCNRRDAGLAPGLPDER
jgi:hypothetical protein